MAAQNQLIVRDGWTVSDSFFALIITRDLSYQLLPEA
jgi:hypothetical protein